MSWSSFWTVVLEGVAKSAPIILQTLIGAGGALMGVWIANANNRKVARQNIEHQNRTLFHDRRLILYTEILAAMSKWTSMVTFDYYFNLESKERRDSHDTQWNAGAELDKIVQQLHQVMLIGSDGVRLAALKLLSETSRLNRRISTKNNSEVEHQVNIVRQSMTDMQKQMRAELLQI